ncbi:MAG: hypothetical protein B6245_09945 [Desulfobacteraceae bacterium 4572_88]|nr:MAG: hypothetical protein B6245_09945 [Desulfobacteraceae bacterium 4572_88]
MSEEKSKSASDDSLSRLSRAVEWSAGMFSLILARCNYAELRGLIIEQLHERCPVQIREITLSSSGRSLHQLITERVKDGMPDAVMVLGLESSADPDTILRGANQIRGKFGKDFPFPVILWISDSILSKFSRSAPDFYSWAGTSLQFRPSDEEFPDALEKIMEKPMFLVDLATQKLRQGTGTLADLSNPQEFDCFLKDLEALPSSLLAPHGSSRLQFLRGIQLQKSGQSRQAVPYYEECFQNVNPEQEAVLLYLIGKCCDDPKRARNCFQECVRIAGECQELAAKSLCCLCGVLKEQEDWDELGRTGKEALELNRSCNQEAECLQCQLFLTETALHREDWEAAEAGVRQILDVLSSREADGDWLDPKQSDRVLELVGETVRTKKKQPELEAKFGAMLLNLLHRIYFQQKHYLEAFQAKQERYSLEQEFGLRAFVGAGRLKARRREYTRKISVAEEIEASGRKNNIEELRKKLAEDNCKLIVFHGVSGVGKSSTLEAGLLPALRQEPAGKYDAIPVLIRSYTNWTGEVSRRVGDAFAETSEAFETLPSPLDSVESVLAELRKVDDQRFLVVLIFDQFEEFFFEHDELGKRREFYNFLKDALNIPAVKIILSLREDYIHYLLECDQYVLEPEDRLRIDFDILGKNFRMSLGNFTRDGAKSVIQSLTRRSNFPLDERLIDRIVDDLGEDTDGVRPIELQIVGSQIEAKGIHTDEAFKPKKELIQAFLEEAVRDCGTENEDVARLILWLLTDDRLTRPLKTRAEIEYELKALVWDTGIEVGDGQLTLVLEILTLAGMIFEVPGQTEKYQLVHDYLTGLIREQTKPLLEELNEYRTKKKIQRQVAEQAFKIAAFAFSVVAAIACNSVRNAGKASRAKDSGKFGAGKKS